MCLETKLQRSPPTNGADILKVARLGDVTIFKCAAHFLQISLRAFLDTPNQELHQLRHRADCWPPCSKQRHGLVKTTSHAAYPGFPHRELQKPCKTGWGGTFRMINSSLNHWWVLWSSANLQSDDLPAYELMLKLLKGSHTIGCKPEADLQLQKLSPGSGCSE